MNNIKLLIGMAGTGKTFNLIELFKNNPSEDKIFLTYTNENANRLAEVYKIKCETIHSHFKINYIKKDYENKIFNHVEYIYLDEIGIIPYDIIKYLIKCCDNLVASIDYLQLLPINAKEHKINYNLHIEGDIFILQQALSHVSKLNLFKFKNVNKVLLTDNKRFLKPFENFNFEYYKNNFININDYEKIKLPVLISKYKDINLFKPIYEEEKIFIHNSGINFLKSGDVFKYTLINEKLVKIIYADGKNKNYISINDFNKVKYTPYNLKIIHTTQGFEFNNGSIYLDSLFLPEMLYTAITRFKEMDQIMFLYKDFNKAKKIFNQQVEIFNLIKKIIDSLFNEY